MSLQTNRIKRTSRRFFSLLLCLILVMSLLPLSSSGADETYGELAVKLPVLLVTGNEIIPGSTYSASSVSNERSYTLEDLKALDSITDTRLYSTINSQGTRRIYLGEGADIAGLLSLSGYTGGGTVKAVSPGTGGMSVSLTLDEPRFYYPNIDSGSDEGEVPVSAMLAWKNKRENAPSIPTEMDDINLTLMAGQTSVTDVNNSLYNGGVNMLLAGGAIENSPLTVNSTLYTRADVLMMPRADRSYTYSTSGGTQTDYVRGVPLAYFAEGHDGEEIINFTAADGYSMSETSVTVTEAIAGNYILAYEKGADSSSLSGIYDEAKSSAPNPDGRGFFTLYGDGIKPSKMIASITISAPNSSESQYKHTSHSGAPYNIDAVTSATLTVEGPGVESSVPISVRELEETDIANIHRGVYADLRSGTAAERTYEGVTVLSILDGLVNSNVACLDDTVAVVFKNRWRQEVGRMTYGEIKGAERPVILAYGTAYDDGSEASPFVFTGGAGFNANLGNGDGPLKLVYDQGASPGSQFVSVAYLYVEEGTPPPGFKHISASDSAYNNVANTEFILTFTGDELGREVNYTVRELEEMAALEPQLTHKDEYNLSNTTYWYVNEYEGIKLWDLLIKMGLDENRAKKADGALDGTPLVSFASWDNYQISAQFSLYQLAHPELFYFYEKSPQDIGTDNRPTKEQLATEEYQPDNQVGTWTTDSNGYPVKAGYPVMLAYGVNSYPYVRNPGMEGYKSGLGNSGGPMRLIYGKTDGLNRSDPDALENYAYYFNNGSQQLQRVQEIYVGNPVRYSTHLENPDYQAMKDDEVLTVEIIVEGSTQTKTFTLAELESILYGEGVTKADREDPSYHIQEKGYYYYKDSEIEDLFEGVGLQYLLTETVGLQGTFGSVELYSESSDSPEAVYDLSKIGSRGYNSLRGTSDLGMMIAFSKNGYPLVAGKDDSGYISTDPVTGKAVKNSGGPLQFVRAQTAGENETGSIDTTSDAKITVTNLTKIVVRLVADKYAHTGAENEAYASQEITFSGSISKAEGISLTVGALETKQSYIVTDTYMVDGLPIVYRGLDLYRLLSDKDIGASSLMDEITVKNAAGDSVTLTVEQLKADGKKVILAYGSGAEGEGAPLDSASGGPMRLIIEGAIAAKCITNVTEIIVRASEISSWKHEGPVYGQYADFKLEISGQNLVHNKTFTAAELEAMDNLIVQDSYKVGNEIVAQGIDLYKLLQNIGFASGLESSDFTAYASDGYSTAFNSSQLANGINGKPVLIAFAQGTTAENGLPLVPDPSSPGYSVISGNEFGPLRLLVHDNSGWAVKYLAKIVVGAAGGSPDPGLSADFAIYGLETGQVSYDIKTLKNLPDGKGALTESYSYTNNDSPVTEAVKGAYLYDLLTLNGTGETALITINCTDGYESKQESYRDIPMSAIKEQKYFVAYDVDSAKVDDKDKSGASASVRIYRNYNDGSDWMNRLTNIKGVTVSDYEFTAYLSGKNGLPNAGIRSLSFDGNGGLWAGTYGGGLVYLPKDSSVFSIYSTAGEPPLMTDFASAAAVDASGGLWFSQNASYTAPGDNLGVGYMKDGDITWYRAPDTIPDDYVQAIEIDSEGSVWFGSFGGITKFDGTNWTTWTKEDGLPAASVNTIVFDGSGGLWVGCYPDGSGTREDPFTGGYAHLNSDGIIDFAKSYSAPYSETAQSSLLADAWVRGMAVDADGGIWVVRSGSYADLPNEGGRVDYVDKDKNITTYTGKELLGSALTVTAALNPEIRAVAIDKNGCLWFGTSGGGLFHCDKPKSIYRVYSTANGSWPSGTAMDNIYCLEFDGDTLYIGTNGGIALSDVELISPAPVITVLDPPFTIKQGGKADITWLIGGSGNSIKNLPSGSGGKVEKSFKYNGTELLVRGAYLSDILAESGISGDDKLLTITTTDGFYRENYLDIPLADISAKNYFIAYDVSHDSGSQWEKVADLDGSNVQASLRLYRSLDSGESGQKNNEIKCLSGLTVSIVNKGGDTPGPGASHVGDATESTAEFKITGAVEKPGYFTLSGLKTYPGVTARTRIYNWKNSYGTTGSYTMTGVFLEDLLKDVMKLSSNAASITVTAKDGYFREFNLDSKDLGVYWTDNGGNMLMLSWQRDSTDSDLRLVVGQIDQDHINLPMWVSDIVSITVNAKTVKPGGGTSGSYESSGTQGAKSDESDEEPPVSSVIKASIQLENGTANAGNTADEISNALSSIGAESESQDGASKILEINAKSEAQTNKTVYTLPVDALSVLTADGKTGVELLTNQGSINFSAELLRYLENSGDGALTVEILSIEELGSASVTDITIRRGSTVISSFESLLKFELPFIPESSQQDESLLLYHIAEDGRRTPVKLAAYFPDSGSMRAGVRHLSKYTVGSNKVSFADIQGHWGQSAVEFLASRGIVNGYSDGTFNPDGNVTRAEYLKMLAESVDGIDLTNTYSSGFSDIPDSAWYSKYVNWAVGLGIVQGYPDGSFRPDSLISREDMTVMSKRFIEAIKLSPDVIQKAEEFTDQDKISVYAAEAVNAMRQYGILNGNPDGSFDPKSFTSRSEAARVITACIEAVLR